MHSLLIQIVHLVFTAIAVFSATVPRISDIHDKLTIVKKSFVGEIWILKMISLIPFQN